ncbi:MAG: CocE/NonD family hydrolase, partial [Calditrichota bacterium]
TFLAPASDLSTSYDQYTSDPDNPVPFTAEITTSMPKPYMVEDQRFVTQRTDVITYQTEILDADITIIGPIIAHLFVSTSGTDADWIVKLIDVYPDSTSDSSAASYSKTLNGYQMLVRGEIMRGKFRNSYEYPEPFIPNEVTEVQFNLNDIFHTFKTGHRIMVQIQSSWFPLFDMNPQEFTDINQTSKNNFRKAVQCIYHTSEYSSSLELNLLPE